MSIFLKIMVFIYILVAWARTVDAESIISNEALEKLRKEVEENPIMWGRGANASCPLVAAYANISSEMIAEFKGDWAVISFLVSERGIVLEAVILASGTGDSDEHYDTVVKIARKWKFLPAVKDGGELQGHPQLERKLKNHPPIET